MTERMTTKEWLEIKAQTANARQVGGDHYQTGGVQHWDLFGSEYLIGNATKYLRYAKKGGIQDLEKAKHYCEKLIELFANKSEHSYLLDGWARNAGLNFVAQMVARILYEAENEEDVRLAMAGIDELISQERIKEIADRIEISVVSKTDDDVTLEVKDVTLDVMQGGPIDMLVVAPGERRVPRYEMPRYDDAAQLATMYPWELSLNQFNKTFEGSRQEIADKFYTWRTPAYRLDPVVTSREIPRELRTCYSVHGNDRWIINMFIVPDEIRDHYPHLQREMNSVEFDQSEHDYQFMYFEDSNGKWCLGKEYDAWGRD